MSDKLPSYLEVMAASIDARESLGPFMRKRVRPEKVESISQRSDGRGEIRMDSGDRFVVEGSFDRLADMLDKALDGEQTIAMDE